MSITMQHHEDGRAGRFAAMSGETTAGVVTYLRIDPTAIRVEHTEVFSGFERSGLGRQLIAFAVDWARRHAHRISPRCPFARHVFESTPEYDDVWFR